MSVLTVNMTKLRTIRHAAKQKPHSVKVHHFLTSLTRHTQVATFVCRIWGTFLLVLVAGGGGVVAVHSSGAVTLGMQVVAPGLMVMAIIYFKGQSAALI